MNLKLQGEITLSVPELDQIREELKVLKDVNRVFKLFVNDQLEQNIKMSEKLDLVYKLTNEMVEKSLKEELQHTMKTCADLYKNDPTMMSGIYTVYPTTRSSVTVFCRIANTTGFYQISDLICTEHFYCCKDLHHINFYFIYFSEN